MCSGEGIPDTETQTTCSLFHTFAHSGTPSQSLPNTLTPSHTHTHTVTHPATLCHTYIHEHTRHAHAITYTHAHTSRTQILNSRTPTQTLSHITHTYTLPHTFTLTHNINTHI